MTKQELILKVQQETYYLRRMFESCKTFEQVKNVAKLASFVILDKWTYFEHKLRLNEQVDVSFVIRDAAGDLDLFENQARARIVENQKVENKKTIKTGYWD